MKNVLFPSKLLFLARPHIVLGPGFLSMFVEHVRHTHTQNRLSGTPRTRCNHVTAVAVLRRTYSGSGVEVGLGQDLGRYAS